MLPPPRPLLGVIYSTVTSLRLTGGGPGGAQAAAGTGMEQQPVPAGGGRGVWLSVRPPHRGVWAMGHIWGVRGKSVGRVVYLWGTWVPWGA